MAISMRSNTRRRTAFATTMRLPRCARNDRSAKVSSYTVMLYCSAVWVAVARLPVRSMKASRILTTMMFCRF